MAILLPSAGGSLQRQIYIDKPAGTAWLGMKPRGRLSQSGQPRARRTQNGHVETSCRRFTCQDPAGGRGRESARQQLAASKTESLLRPHIFQQFSRIKQCWRQEEKVNEHWNQAKTVVAPALRNRPFRACSRRARRHAGRVGGSDSAPRGRWRRSGTPCRGSLTRCAPRPARACHRRR